MNLSSLPPELKNFVSSASEIFDEMQMKDGHSAHDACSYSIFLDPDPTPDPASAYASICDFVARLSQDYMWFREPFILGPPEPSSQAHHVMTGSIRFGDCVDDEWFLVYLLLELSKAMPNVSCRISDTDGEFMLIEAADLLPAWVTPENSTNRVWIRGGALHLVPLDEPGRLPSGGIQLERALECCLRTSEYSRASASIQSCIAARTTNAYPAYSLATRHVAVCALPRSLANVFLDHTLMLVPAAINALCSPVNEDKTKSISSLGRFGSEFADDDDIHRGVVVVRIRFTRALFARLTFQPFTPPQRLHAWARRATSEIINATAGTRSVTAPGEARRLAARSVDLGCRLICGLEAAYQAQARTQARGGAGVQGLFDLRAAVDSGGGGGGNGNGSILEEASLQGDDESWLHLSPSQLEVEMQGRVRSGGCAEEKGVPSGTDPSPSAGKTTTTADETASTEEMQRIVEGMERFMTQKSGLRGVASASTSTFTSSSMPASQPESGGLTVDLDRLESILRGIGLSEGKVGDGGVEGEDGVDEYDDYDDDSDEDDSDDEDEDDSDDEFHEGQDHATAGCANVLLPEDDASDSAQSRSTDSDDAPLDSDEYAALMEEELRDSTLFQSFERNSDGEIDVERNLLAHLLESHASQGGQAGPASNLISQLGLRLPEPNLSGTVEEEEG